MYSVEFFKKIIIEYYECLSNDIDIETENCLRDNLSNKTLIEKIQNRRNNRINKIKLTKKDNLVNLDTIQNHVKSFYSQENSELVNYELFKNGFLFFIKDKKFGNPEDIFNGILIYKKGYISEFSRRKFK